MKALSFGFEATIEKGKRIRRSFFEKRSELPRSAACLASGSMCETLTSLWAAPVGVRLLEPAIPSLEAWTVIERGATIFRIKGSIADAAIVLRPADALALASAAFGESAADRSDRPLSPLERTLLERTVAALAIGLRSICGSPDSAIDRIASIRGFETYFEVAIERPMTARIGIALSRDPAPEAHGRLSMDDIGAVEIEPSVVMAVRAVSAGQLARLTTDTVLPLPARGAFRGSLSVGGRTLARGTCGKSNGRFALAIEEIVSERPLLVAQ